MLFGYIRLFKILTRRQHLVILVTTFMIPISVELVQGLIATGLCSPLTCVHFGLLTFYVVWYQIATLLFAWSTRKDRTEEEAKLTRISCVLNESITQLREDHERRITGNQDRVGDLQRWAIDTRRVLQEEFGVVLPAIPVSLRLAPTSFEILTSTASVNVRRSRNKMARLRSWVNRQALRFRGFFRKWVLGLDNDHS